MDGASPERFGPRSAMSREARRSLRADQSQHYWLSRFWSYADDGDFAKAVAVSYRGATVAVSAGQTRDKDGELPKVYVFERPSDGWDNANPAVLTVPSRTVTMQTQQQQTGERQQQQQRQEGGEGLGDEEMKWRGVSPLTLLALCSCPRRVHRVRQQRQWQREWEWEWQWKREWER